MSLPKPAKAAGLQLVSFAVAAVVVLAVSRLYPLDDLLRALNAFIRDHQPWSTVAYPFLHAACNLLLLPAGVPSSAAGSSSGCGRDFCLP